VPGVRNLSGHQKCERWSHLPHQLIWLKAQMRGDLSVPMQEGISDAASHAIAPTAGTGVFSSAGQEPTTLKTGLILNLLFEEEFMSDFDRPTRDPVDRTPVARRAGMSPTGPIFSNSDMAAGIVAAPMILGPLAMAAFAVGRH
jgi:hypothetical protein